MRLVYSLTEIGKDDGAPAGGKGANLAANNKDELWGHVVDELVEVKYRPDLLRGFIRQAGLPGVCAGGDPCKASLISC